MRRLSIALLSGVLAVALMATTAQAANPHLKGRDAVKFTDNGLSLTATVSYAGLGNFDTFQELTATGNTIATCTNPAGATQPPGQNPAPTTVSGGTAVPASDIKNGNVTITTTTGAPVTPIPGAPGCPNPQWTESIVDIAFTSATIKLSQDQDANGSFETLVLTVNCTFSSPTSNGAVPSSNFTCTTA